MSLNAVFPKLPDNHDRAHTPVASARDIIDPLFLNDNIELHNLIRKSLILPYLTDSFHQSLIEEYADGLFMALQ